jgi:hypothetical protein
VWEYKVVSPGELARMTSYKSVEAYLNELGGQGWELVTVLREDYSDGYIFRVVLYLKRLKA